MEPYGKPLLLILARDLAANVATPMFVINEGADLVYYNEAAESILGRKFGVAGELSRKEWATMWKPRDENGDEIPLSDLPLSKAIKQNRPAHMAMNIVGMDDLRRRIEVVAYPLMAHGNEFVGAVAIFWEI